jgi:tetratricopeptide (TPR) repeat protein
MGRVYEERRQLERALDVYRQAISRVPHDLEGYRRSLAYKAMKSYPDAVAMFRKAAELARARATCIASCTARSRRWVRWPLSTASRTTSARGTSVIGASAVRREPELEPAAPGHCPAPGS